MMETVRPLQALQALLAQEALYMDDLANTLSAFLLSKTRNKILAHLQEIKTPADVSQLVAAEKSFVKNDLKHFTNSAGMKSSLSAAMMDLSAVETLLKIIADPNQYQLINLAYSLPKNREGGLPLDEARQAFRSHSARLNNLDRARLNDDEKNILDARRDNINSACKHYALLQTQALA